VVADHQGGRYQAGVTIQWFSRDIPQIAFGEVLLSGQRPLMTARLEFMTCRMATR
jgi:hypothetical protein